MELTQSILRNEVVLEIRRSNNGGRTSNSSEPQNEHHNHLVSGRHLQFAHYKVRQNGTCPVRHNSNRRPSIADTNHHHEIATGAKKRIPICWEGMAVKKRREYSNDGHDGGHEEHSVKSPAMPLRGGDAIKREDDGGLDQRHGEAVYNVGVHHVFSASNHEQWI